MGASPVRPGDCCVDIVDIHVDIIWICVRHNDAK